MNTVKRTEALSRNGYVDLLRPQDIDWRIDDIAHSLSLINRYNGITNYGFSVAQHSVLVSMLCDEKDALDGLLHDGHESIMGDLTQPVKSTLDQLMSEVNPSMSREHYPHRVMERNLEVEMRFFFKIGPDKSASVAQADLDACFLERYFYLPADEVSWGDGYGNPWLEENKVDLLLEKLPNRHLVSVPMSPRKARTVFIERYIELTKS